jgi:uncharacterized short protein YbdD (DUF466 family)
MERPPETQLDTLCSAAPQASLKSAGPTTRWQLLLAAFRSALGAPDYRAYAAHRAAHHPGQTLLSPREFFRERQAAKYRRGSSRCC